MTTKPRVGFLGVGWIGRHRMEAILATGAVEAAAMADPSAECLAAAQALAPEAQAVAGLDEMLGLDLATRFGAAETIPMDDHWAIIEEVKRLTGGTLCDRVIEAVGKQWPLDLAGELVAEGGKLIVAGYHQDGPRQVNMQMWNWKGIDVINAHERDPAMALAGVREAVAAVAAGRLDPARLYTNHYPLERLGEALDATRDKPGDFVKALVTLQPGDGG